MNFRLLVGAMLLAALLAVPAAAQYEQDPLDEGAADSVIFVIEEPEVNPGSQVIAVQLYFWHDVQRVFNMSMGFSWDNPKFQMDSVRWSQLAVDSLDMMRLAYFRNNRDSTNARQFFQAVGLPMYGRGLHPEEARQLVVTYYFHVTDWTAADQFCVNLEFFNAFAFVDLDNDEYAPIWGGPYCVGNVPTGVLEVTPSTLNFSGVAGGPAPAAQTFTVSEQSGDFILFRMTATEDWIDLTNVDSTTPELITVNVDIGGLSAGDYAGEVLVTSPEATNETSVAVNLHLEAPNQPPVLAPIGNRETDENQLLEFTVSATDPDATTPSLSTSALPGTASFVDHGDGTGTFSWTPGYDDAGSYPVTFIASDGDLTDQEQITITVNNVNRPPVLAAIGSQQVSESVNLNFGISASDPDADALTLTAETLPGTASFTDHGDGTGTFDWTPGNTDAGIYNVWFIVTDGVLADSELVTIEVLDADGFVLNPNPLVFSASFGGANPDPQTFNISVSDGSVVQFLAEETAGWFSIDPAAGPTPATVTVTVDVTGLAAGFYRDSILISDNTPDKGAEALDPVWEYVELTIGNNLVVDPTALSWEISEGDLVVNSLTFDVSEQGGGAIAFEATTEAAWLILTDNTGTTPGTVTVDIDLAAVTVGVYNASIMVSADAVNSPVEVSVSLTVLECPVLAPATVVYNRTAFAGEWVTLSETLSLTSSGPGEIAWEAPTPLPSPFIFGPADGTTPTDVTVSYSRLFESQGEFSDTAYITAIVTDVHACPSEVMVVTNVTVYRPPSADTVIVVNTPAVSGMRVGVPVIFTNSCPLSGLGLSLNWTVGFHLDSVSFVGSAIAYLEDKTANINNDLYDVTILASAGQQAMVPVASEQLLATLWFALPCEVEEGAYPFALGSYPPLTPADVYFYRDCGEGQETEFPEYIEGNIIIGAASNFVCGYVVDPEDNEIEGATVELWEDYPFTEPLMSTLSSSIGGFAFDDITVIPFDLYAYKDGYYPGKVEDINFGDKGIKIVLEPLPEHVTPTSEWVDYYCPEDPQGAVMFLGAPVPVGAIVEAYTQNNLLVGQMMVTTRGHYGFMPVYRANDDFGDPGARTGDLIRFTINGMDAIATGNTLYPAEYAQVEVCLEVRGTVEKVCTLFAGWNLISWNVNTDTDEITTVLDPIMDYVDVVLGFEQRGLTFDPNLPMFSTLWNVDHLSGYWVRIEGIDQVDLTLTGLPVVETTPIALTAGWNLVSYLREESWPVETALANVDHFTLFAYGFPDGQIEIWQPGGQFNQLETFDPCNGYWIKTTSAGWLVYNGLEPTPSESRPQIDAAALGSDGVIASANWINLYSGDLRVDGEPVPAGATVTAFAVDGDQAVGSFTLTTDGRFGFMPVYADVAGESEVGLKAGDPFYLKVNDVPTEQTFTWTTNGDRIEVPELTAASSIGDVLPGGYSLAQNYPNPFNPSTHVIFAMPVAGTAKIEVFNVLGRSVAVIFEGVAQAGEHEVVWDGRDASGAPAASGVYFYRLTADNYTETRKMMLLK